jgi:hypothetical protein
MPNMRASIESLRGSLRRITPIPTGCVSELLEDEINHDNPAETQVHNEAHDSGNEDDDEDEDASTLPEGVDNQGRDDILSKNTEEDQKIVLATGPGNQAAVWVWTGKTVRFGSRPIQTTNPERLGGPNPQPRLSTRRFCRVWLDPSVPISSFHFRVFLFMVTVICYCYDQNIQFGTSFYVFVSLAAFIIKTQRDMLPATSSS